MWRYIKQSHADLDLTALVREWESDAPDAAPAPVTLDSFNTEVERTDFLVHALASAGRGEVRELLARIDFSLDGLVGMGARLASGA